MEAGEKLKKASIDYYAAIIWRKVWGTFLSYPEFLFIGKIFIGVLILIICILLFNKYFAIR